MHRTIAAIAVATTLATAASLAHAVPTAAVPEKNAAAAADAADAANAADVGASLKHAIALRAQAEQLSGPASSPKDVERAVALYQQALDYLTTPAARDRAAGDKALIAEQVNLDLSQAIAYAKLGQKQQALTALDRLANLAWSPALGSLLAHEDLHSLRDEPRFKALQVTMNLPVRLSTAAAIATPWKPVLTTEEKVAGLSLFWAEARRNFVYFDHVPQLQWDQVYMDYLAKVIAAPTTEDYYRIMITLAPLLQDAHTNIVAPQQLAQVLYAQAPLNTALIEDKVIVLHVGQADVAARIRRGDDIYADGSTFVGQGIAPDVEVPQTIAALRAGRDLGLERAAANLRQR